MTAMADFIHDDSVIACANLVGRAGAAGFQIGYLHDDVPIAEAGWHATARFRGERIIVEDHRSAADAAQALAQRLLTDAVCRCRKPVTVTDGQAGCRWRLIGQCWEPGCDAPQVEIPARGDLAGIRAAFAVPPNRDARRAQRRRGPR